MMITRSILHMDLDTFFVSCERLMDHRLHGKPVLIGGTSDRGVVASCSYEARKFGIHSAMPMKMARQLCPEAIVIRGNSPAYAKFSSMVTDIIKDHVPLFEKTSIDEFYVDLTGYDRYYNSLKLADEVREKIIHHTGLPISYGLSINKTVSKIATGEAKPNNRIKIDEGTEKSFLAPLAVNKIPMVGEKTYQRLRNLGVKNIKTLQEMPFELVKQVFGKNGITLWNKANGIDPSPVEQYNERKSISTERTFDKDTIDVVKLKGFLIAMTENLAFQLRAANKVTSCITLKIRYADFNTYTRQRKIEYTAADHVMIPVVLDLFQKLYHRRVLIRLIGLKMSHLVNGSYQLKLFENASRMANLYHAMDRVRKQFGDRAVIRASGMNAKTLGRLYNPFSGEPPTLLANRKT